MAFNFSSLFKPKQAPNTVEIIKAIDYKGGTKIAANETNYVYADVEELGGFHYLKTVIIGDISVKIKRTGCTVILIFKNDAITLNSDDTTVESTQINKTSVYYTQIDFELDTAEADKIKKEKIKEIQYTFKNKTIAFPAKGS